MSDEINNLPRRLVIPVFPLPNVVLFPKVHLPLHIFEPRYRQMIKDTMAGSKLIGMALLQGEWSKNYHGNPDIYPIGCVGEIVSATALPDGRFNIVLYGLKEFQIVEQILEQTPYRQATVLLREQAGGTSQSLAASVRSEILDLVRQTADEKDSDLVKILADPSLDDATWLNLCCFSVESSMLEKQSLLEAPSLGERAQCLVNVLHFKVAERRAPFEGLKESKEQKPPN
jgi:Lon protease-like protein